MIELVGANKVVNDMHGISERLGQPGQLMRRELSTLEAAAQGTFAELGGRYVDTGAVKRSLTLPEAPGAIRRVTASAMEFGTDIPYARYLTERIGAQGERPLPVAVLKLSETTAHQVAHDVLDHVVGHAGGPGLGGSFVASML